jgi:hypothetical protein
VARSGQHRRFYANVSRFWLGAIDFLWRTIKEFLPNEICGVTAAVGLSWIVFHLSGSYGWGAFFGEVGEFIGYYGCAFIREYRRHTEYPLKATFGQLSTFIPAEAFDWSIGISLARVIPRHFKDYRLGMLIATVTASALFTGVVLLTRWLVRMYQNRRAIRALMAEADQAPVAVGARD